MANSLKERLADKEKIKKMSLEEIATKYGRNDLFNEEVARRRVENLDEVIAYLDNVDEIDKITSFLQISPLEIFTRRENISDLDANKYLKNDFSWLNNENIYKKVSIEFLKDVLIGYRKIIEYPHLANYLLQYIPEEQIESTLLSLQGLLNFNDFLNILNNLPERIFNQINLNTNYIEKMLYSIKYNEMREKIILSSFYSKLSNENKKYLFNSLWSNEDFRILLNNNELYQEYKLLFSEQNLKEKFYQNFKVYGNKIFKMGINLHNSLLFRDLLNNLSYLDLEKIFDFNDKEVSLYLWEIIESKDYGAFKYFVQKYPNFYEQISHMPNFVDLIIKQLTSPGEGTFNLTNFLDLWQDFPKCIDDIFNNPQYEKFFSIITPTIYLEIFEKYPPVEKKFMSNANFMKYITSTPEITFSFMSLLNKYKITNPMIEKFNSNFQKLQTVRPELSYCNSSLRMELLNDDVIDILGIDNINGILNYRLVGNVVEDTSDIVIDIYKENKLVELKKWLDVLQEHISSNHRLLHYYIRTFASMANLRKEILENPSQMTAKDWQILEEIMCNLNRYHIDSINDLRNYFKIRVNTILDKSNDDRISTADFEELFLNHSALRAGPGNIGFKVENFDYDYYKYMYADKGVITEEELEFLRKVAAIPSQDRYYNKSDIMPLIEEYYNKDIPTIREILLKIEKAEIAKINDELLDINKLREIASTTDREAPVFIEIVDGQEYIHLKGYDYKFLTCGFTNNINGTTNGDSITSDSRNKKLGGLNQIIMGEKLKEKYGYQISKYTVGNLLSKDPENWNLVEGTSTISSGIISPRYGYSPDGFSWGKNSNLSILGISRGDAAVSHELRSLEITSNTTFAPYCDSMSVLYGKSKTWAEVWFDRKNSVNKKIQSEFLVEHAAPTEREEVVIKKYPLAQQLHCPIVVIHQNYYGPDFEKRLDLEARKEFITTLDINKVKNIIYNSLNTDMNEKFNFIVGVLEKSLASGKINHQEFYQKLLEFKYSYYYAGIRPLIDEYLKQHVEISLENTEDFSRSRGKVNLLYMAIILGVTILLGILIAFLIRK